MQNQTNITLPVLKEFIWAIDKNKFREEISKAAKKYKIIYHRDYYLTMYPYEVNTIGQNIHVEMGSKRYIKQYMDYYKFQSIKDTMMAMAEDILLEIAYIIYGLNSEENKLLEMAQKEPGGETKTQLFHALRKAMSKRHEILACARKKLFGRDSPDPSIW